MNLLRHLYSRIRISDGGQTMAEYALIVLAIAVVCIAGYQTFGTTLKTDVTNVNTEL